MLFLTRFAELRRANTGLLAILFVEGLLEGLLLSSRVVGVLALLFFLLAFLGSVPSGGLRLDLFLLGMVAIFLLMLLVMAFARVRGF